MRIPIIAVLLLALLIAAFFMPGYLRGRAQLEKTMLDFELLQASVDAGAGLLEYKHRLVEATAALERMRQLDAGFALTPAGTELEAALQYYGQAPDWREQKSIREKKVLLQFSEVPIRAADEGSLKVFRDAVRLKLMQESQYKEWLEPSTLGELITDACLKRAAGHLLNAEIAAGRKSGGAYKEPFARAEEEWIKAHALEHPLRKKEYDAWLIEKSRRDTAQRIETDKKAATWLAAHLQEWPLHIEIASPVEFCEVRVVADGEEVFDGYLSRRKRQHVDARSRVVVFALCEESEISVSVNGKPWSGPWEVSALDRRERSAVFHATR